MGFYLKDPGATIDYAIDWAAGYLGGRLVTESSWSVHPSEAGGVTVAGDVREDTRTFAKLSGGIAGNIYRVVNRVVLSDGQIDERTLSIRVDER